MNPRPSLALFLLLTAACGAGESFQSTATPPHPVSLKAPDAVEVVDAPVTARNPVEIGIIKATSSAHSLSSDGHEDVLEHLRKAAGEHGCDAIVLSPIEQKLFATSGGTPLYRAHQTARCYVYP